ncbi:SDR family NAD(P)-dependent oxidoreductase [Allorhodopirellula solitaria]|uniref:3-oxoacyl-[acyl-carrier-protein] reductase FabG n=1 Tax=Allorhodopirellula solitaria TaxID=2527987 RepID=A0A5C5XYB8_9BACT|nr:SDR family NAD(P)-dependent oxidoreductase [Allorhodopirellula solitaria]TWT67521.1 3-oxoacyl-[acyl-carrier-protein] reductase FabG [Allorhodopirellula solitaria]
MDLGISQKTALVTGSSAGIGLATATRLAAEGAQVWINGRSEDRLQAAAKTIGETVAGADVKYVVADLGTAAGCESLCQQVPAVDILVNNVGIFEPKSFAEIPDDDWTKMFNVNVMSGVRLTRHYLSGMLQSDWGRIIFVSSESGVQIPDEMIHYGMTKTAQLAVARGVAETTAKTGVTVNSVLVGPTKSEGVGTFVEEMARDQGVTLEQFEKDFFSNVRPTSIIQRFIEVDEVSAMICYLCSGLASATNGAALRVDGGVVKSIL